MMKDDLGDRMKGFERIETSRVLNKHRPIYARIDGRGFSKFTRGLNRPFDLRMTAAMQQTTARLVKSTGARIGYTQSDEISLVWLVDSDRPDQEIMFGGKVQKMTSILAAQATALFTREVATSEDESFRAYVERTPHFDARVFQLPTRQEAVNALIWRENDARRNAVSMAAQDRFSHRELQGKSVRDMLTMLADDGIVFDDFPGAFRNGTYVKKVSVARKLSEAELRELPAAINVDPESLVIRSEMQLSTEIPLLSREDRIDFVFGGEDRSSTNSELAASA
jgi:tRNA(His) 5'-end guanylyltransferase